MQSTDDAYAWSHSIVASRSKQFYERFKSERSFFMAQINGIEHEADREGYASLLLTRLMFLYFLRCSGLLEDSGSHIMERLIYDRKANELDKTPLLSFSLFKQHALERDYPAITIPDDAFSRMCAFFDDYQWQIDEDIQSSEQSITPAALSYLYERHTNQKQTGTYYTREDIATYIATFTIIPYLLRALETCALIPGCLPWHLLSDRPHRYIYPAPAYSYEYPLPEAIARGVSNVEQRGGWDASAPAPFALPGETWREVVTRRQRYQALLSKLQAGKLRTIDELITENLDICRFALDIIESCQNIEVVIALHGILTSMTILDPTCGTGAFLLTALNVLEPLYVACLKRAEQLQMNAVASRVEQVANRSYAIRRTIIASNLYGVDIMEEAIELCQARLYLKLLASAGSAHDVQELPHLASHIRAGNILTGAGDERDEFSIIIGNPPYIEYEKVNPSYSLDDYKTRSTGNLYAMTIERCTRLMHTGGCLGMIVPASSTCASGYKPLQQLLLGQSRLHIASFSDQRGKLFDIPHPRLCIILYSRTPEQSSVSSTTYMKAGRKSRSLLFQCLSYCNVSKQVMPGIIPRYGSAIERSIHTKLYSQSHCVGDYVVKHSEHSLYHTRKLSWFVQVTPFIPTIIDEQGANRLPSELKTLHFASAAYKDMAFVALNSHLFYWFITTRSDGRNLNMRDVLGLPFNLDGISENLRHILCQLAFELSVDLQAHAEMRTMHFRQHGTLTIQCVFPGRSIVILDRIDRALARIYAFTAEELDFLLHFDRKFRVS